MLVTINTDASYHHAHKVGAYAFWIVCNEGRFTHAGALRNKINRPEEAEFMCIINALHVLGLLGYKNISKVIINTDCLNVIHLLQNNKSAVSKYNLKFGKPLVAKFNKVRSSNKLSKIPVELRHVKAHTTTDTSRAWVNDYLDKKAKEMLWLQINKPCK